MTTLGDIESISDSIKKAPFQIVKTLFRLVYEREGDRHSRKRVREFTGFAFGIESEEYQNKLEYITNTFSEHDLTLISSVLYLDHNKSKQDLAKSICNNLIDLNSLRQISTRKPDEEEDDDEGVGPTQDDQLNEAVNTTPNREDAMISRFGSMVSVSEASYQPPMFPMNFRDVEDSIRAFDGTSMYPVEKWISDFEDMATLFGWSELHKYIFAKKSLTGLAKLYIQGETGIKSWAILKESLKEEFSKKLSSVQLHQMLAGRKMQTTETIQEYFLHMKELASRGSIEPESLIQYVIDGINDEPNNKIILYGATKIDEFKNKLKIYSEFKAKHGIKSNNTSKENTVKNVTKPRSDNKFEKIIRCFNCGIQGHKSSECKSKAQGFKCFKCNQFGHRSFECKGRNSGVSSSNKQATNISNITTKAENKMCKIITVNNHEIEVLIDTGSPVNIVDEQSHKAVGSPELCASDLILMGFGRSQTKVKGYFDASINIDDDTYKSKVYVAPDDAMDITGIIGNELLDQTNLFVTKEGVTITKRRPDESIMQIHVEPHEFDIGDDISKDSRNKVTEMLLRYEPKRPKDTNVEMNIILKNEEPIASHPRRLPFTERTIVEDQVNEWLKEGIVENSESEFASPVVIARKKNGAPRLCIDYRKINKVIVKDRFPLPLIEDVLDKLQQARIFSTIDLKNGFFHVNVAEDSRKYTAFVIHNGHYQFRKMPFGLCNSPSIFTRYINRVFRTLINDGIALPYIDDVIIPAADEDDAVEKLAKVLEIAEEYGLEINIKKCQFLKKKIEFLGHVIENGKLLPSPEKVKAVMRFPKPKTTKQVQSFLGLTGYFRKFIPYYSIVAKPLSDLLRGNAKFQFKERQNDAFEQLKKILSDQPILAIYREEGELEVHTDASKDGYGAILFQRSLEDHQLHPVYYASRKTSEAESKYSSYELEVLAIVEALKKFRVYLLGRNFKIVTDCAAFTKTMEKRDLTTRVARWAMLLEEYNYKIEHRAGTRMRHVDSLSRNPVNLITIGSTNLEKIKDAQEADPETRAIKEIVRQQPYEDYMLKNGILYRQKNDKELLVVPRTLQNELIKMVHGDGHLSAKKIEGILNQDYHIPKVSAKIQNCLSGCVSCILANRKRGKQEGFLNPLHKEEVPLCTYHIDHLGPLETTNKNYKHILVVVDAFTKFVWLYPTRTTTAAEVITKLEQQKVIFGNPINIISDRGTAFTAQEFEDYCQRESIKHFRITTGLPRSNGQAERINSIIIPILTKLSIEDPTKWYKHVGRVQSTINSIKSRSINTTPFELLTGVKLRTKPEEDIKTIIEEEMRTRFIEAREDLREEAKIQIKKVQEENRRSYNLRRRPPNQYSLNDLVAIRRTQIGPGSKLKPKYIGPYRVSRVKYNNTYDVQREGYHEGPKRTTTCAEYMKPWPASDQASETDDLQDGRDVGLEPLNRPQLVDKRGVMADDE